jgi:rSAM/selenodomain-associated transferase 1
MKNALIIFVKTPVPGLVKTRLQPDLTKRESAQVYIAFLKDLDTKFYNRDNYACWYAVSPELFDEHLLGRIIHLDNYFLQNGCDLGERMNHAFQTLFSEGYNKVVLIGSDLPSLPSGIISQAFQKLDSNDCVIGPSRDGGYYLIALKNPLPTLFQGLVWSSSSVYNKTIKFLDKTGVTYFRLPELADIDTAEELISFYQDLKEETTNKFDFPRHSWEIVQKLFTD